MVVRECGGTGPTVRMVSGRWGVRTLVGLHAGLSWCPDEMDRSCIPHFHRYQHKLDRSYHNNDHPANEQGGRIRMTRNGVLVPADEPVSSATVTITCDTCQRRRSIGLSAPVIRSDQQPDGLVESTCPTCGEMTVVGFRYTDGR